MLHAEYWYRAGDDPDQSIRDQSQMMGSSESLEQVLTQIASLRAQNYNVQRVVVGTICPKCDGKGDIGIKPKHTRRQLPNWMLTWVKCLRCNGEGVTAKFDVTL